MNFASVLTAAATGLFSGGVGVALINAIFNRGGQRAESATKLAKAARDKAETVASDHKLWQEEAKIAYRRIEGECMSCVKKLDAISAAFYGLLDDLNELAGDDPRTLRAQVRSAARKARAIATSAK